MHTDILLNDKSLRVTLSPAAERALANRDTPLLVEMELYFSCLIRKQVRFHEQLDDADAVAVNERLRVRFHPVMSQVCSVDEHLDGPPLADFPIVHGERFSPSWLEIGYEQGQWRGQFGYEK
jgi:hypothetical protein